MEHRFGSSQYHKRVIALVGLQILLLYFGHMRRSRSLVKLLQEVPHRLLIALDLALDLLVGH